MLLSGILGSFFKLKVSTWSTGFLQLIYIYIYIYIYISSGHEYPKRIFFSLPLFRHEIELQSLRFGHAPQGWPSSWAR